MLQLVYKYVLKAVASIVLFVSSTSASATSDWLNDFTSTTKKASDAVSLPGFAFTVVKPNGQTVTVTHGLTHDNGKAINKDTIFRLASVSKTFTSVITAKLVKQGQLSWNLPLQQLLPNTRFNGAVGTAVTLEHIVSQSSGYMPNAYDNLIEANYAVDRVLRQLAELEPICSPGKCYTYQNALFAAVEKGIQHHTDKSYQTLLKQQLFTPLNMTRASVGLKPLVEDANWARPHVQVRKGQFKQTRVKPAYYRYSAASGVNASIEDMSKWLRLMLGHHPEVLSKKQIAQLIEPKTKTTKELRRRHWRDHLKQAHYGLGWRVYEFDNEKLVHHGGWVSGYRADVTFAPDYGIGMAFLTNGESNLINKLSVDFWDRFFESVKTQKQNHKTLASVHVPKP